MAVVRQAAVLETAVIDEEMTDDQMQHLLAQAAARLKSQSSALSISDRKNKFNFPKLNPGQLEKAYVSQKNGAAKLDTARLLEDKQRKQAEVERKVVPKIVEKKTALEKKKADAGSNWFNMPKTDLTPELKRDLQLLKMRNVLDPHRHYKKENGKMQAPEYSQVGSIVEGPTEFFSGRLDNKQRKKTFVEEVLAGEQETGRFKRKYGEIQGKNVSGKKAFYNALKAKRKGGGIRKGGG